MAARTLADHLAAHETLFGRFVDWSADMTEAELATPSLCPDWDVRGVVAHTLGVEVVLDGWAPSTDAPPPFGRMSEFADRLAGRSPAEVADEVRAVTTSRLTHLRSLGDDAASRPSITPTGVRTYGDFLRIRVFDLWVHAHDIGIPLGRPADLGALTAAIALDEVAGAIGYVIGKKVGLPDGMSAVVHVTGEVERDLAVLVDGRAQVVDDVDRPDVTITADVETFVLLAAGRVDPQERIAAGRITWSGDAEWGERTARHLAYTM